MIDSVVDFKPGETSRQFSTRDLAVAFNHKNYINLNTLWVSLAPCTCKWVTCTCQRIRMCPLTNTRCTGYLCASWIESRVTETLGYKNNDGRHDFYVYPGYCENPAVVRVYE
jgi:hypothetical protein